MPRLSKESYAKRKLTLLSHATPLGQYRYYTKGFEMSLSVATDEMQQRMPFDA